MCFAKSVTLAFIVLVVLVTAPSAQAAVTAYYRFDSNNGAGVSNGQVITSADDSSGNNRSGVPIGTPHFGSTPFANPVPSSGAPNQFSYLGGSGNGILLSGSSTPVLGSSFTVETFFRLSSTDPNTGDAKAILRAVNATTAPFALSIINLDGIGGTNDIILTMNSDSFELYRKNIAINTNYHVAVTCDGANVNLFLDGILADSGVIPGGFAGTGTIAAAIGNDPQAGGAAFQGNLDELRISDVALTPSQFLDAVPEPVCLPMFGIAALALTRRQRVRSTDSANPNFIR